MNRTTKALLGLAILAAGTGMTGTAEAQGILIDRRCVQPEPQPRPLDIRPEIARCRPEQGIVRTRTDVRIRMTDRVLRYEVEETFINRGGRIGEADYVFPLPKDAAFEDLQLEINGELVAGETYDADEARRIYEEIVRSQRDPALVEWIGNGVLRTRIFPINPGETRRVVVRFQSVVAREGDAYRVDYFGGTKADATRPGVETSPVNLVLEYPGRDGFGRAFSPTHSVDVRARGNINEVTVRGDARDATILVPRGRANAAAVSVLTNAPGREDGFAMITITPPAPSRSTASTARDVTLVLDVSGSMAGVKMTQARAAGHQVLETLRPQDRFRLIDFSTDVNTFRDAFVFATPENLRAARRYLDGLAATGSTNIEAALREAIRGGTTSGRLPLILFVTDGAPTVGERDPIRLADIASRDAANRPRVFSFGVGADVNVTLLEQLAIEGRGTSQFVRPDESVERSVELVASRLVDPLLTDVRIRTTGGVTLNRMLPAAGADIFAGQDLVVFARYRGDGRGTVVVEGMQNGRRVEWTTAVNFPERDRDNGFVGRLWASQRIGFLSAERRRTGGSPEVDAEIRTLGERFGIPTEFTSYFVQEPGLQLGNAAAPPRVQGSSAAGGQASIQTRGAVGGTARGVTPVAPAAASFEAARTAADQRMAKSTVALDSMRRQSMEEAGAAPSGVVTVEGRTFRLEKDVWTDMRPADKLRDVTIRAYSRAYFDLVKQIPELAKFASVGEQVTVVGRGVVISIRSATGAATLTPAELGRIAGEW